MTESNLEKAAWQAAVAEPPVLLWPDYGLWQVMCQEARPDTTDLCEDYIAVHGIQGVRASRGTLQLRRQGSGRV